MIWFPRRRQPQSSEALDRLEQGVLDSSQSLSDLLRYVLLIGGYADSEPLKQWAARELRGYLGVPDAEVPEYRRIHAPITVDLRTPFGVRPRQIISSLHLPARFRERFREELTIPTSVFQLGVLANDASPGQFMGVTVPGAAELCALMSADESRRRDGVTVDALYWAVSPSELHNILDQVRTRLTQFVVELRQGMSGTLEPTPAQVHQAVQTININAGDNSPIIVNAPVAYAEGVR